MFWDSSALVPCLVPERRSADMTALIAADAAVTIWWGTPLECLSALEAKRREVAAPLGAPLYTNALARLAAIVASASKVTPADPLRTRAEQCLKRYPLRAADALQLAAALLSGQRELVTLDVRLAEAARAEALIVLPS